MNSVRELLPKTWLIQLHEISDLRGAFVKTISSSMLSKLDCQFDFREEYYSISKKNVIRGMHFQKPPYDHVKIVYCASGSVLDVLLDLRPGPTYGKSCSCILDFSVPAVLIIPKGVAHGFKSLVDASLMIYKTSSEYAFDYDSGVLWNSFGFDWGVSDPILSDRDKTHLSFEYFNTPFSSL